MNLLAAAFIMITLLTIAILVLSLYCHALLGRVKLLESMAHTHIDAPRPQLVDSTRA